MPLYFTIGMFNKNQPIINLFWKCQIMSTLELENNQSDSEVKLHLLPGK